MFEIFKGKARFTIPVVISNLITLWSTTRDWVISKRHWIHFRGWAPYTYKSNNTTSVWCRCSHSCKGIFDCYFLSLLHFCIPVLELNGLMTSVSGNGLVCLGVWKRSPCPCVWLGVGGLQKSKDDWLWTLQPDDGPTSFSPRKQRKTLFKIQQLFKVLPYLLPLKNPPTPFCQTETLPLFGVPGGSLFTFTLRGVLASAGCSWVGDWSLSWGEGEGSCGDGDCNWGRDCEMGDWSWGAGDFSWAEGWGTGDWSWGPPPGVDESSLLSLAPVGPLRHGSSWVRGSMSTGPPDIWDKTQEKNINYGTEIDEEVMEEQMVKRVQRLKSEWNGGRRNGEHQETRRPTQRSKGREIQRPQLVAQSAV